MTDLISVREAQQRILAKLKPIEIETVPLTDCLNRVLGEDIRSPLDLPPFPNSSMDGFAVRTDDIKNARPESPVDLEIVANIPAGTVPQIRLMSGQAARIMTGAMIPDGADAVIPVEDTNFDPALQIETNSFSLSEPARIFHPAQPGAYIRPRGQDIQQGQTLLHAGRLLQAQDIGMLATIGRATISVFRQPRVAILSSGDELIPPGQAIKPGQIYDSNQFVITAILEQAGASVLRLGNVPDQPVQIKALLDLAVTREVDLIVTSAGVSVGAYDYLRQVIQTDGQLDFWKVNMRPGKPLVFGHYSGKPLIGLPGNPVSAFVGCRVFAVPAVRYLSGASEIKRVRKKAFLAEAIESDGRESYLRAVVQEKDGRTVAQLTGHQGSGNIFSLVQANALLIVPSGVKSLPIDSQVEFWPLDSE